MDGETRRREEVLKKEKAVMSQQIDLLSQQLEEVKDRERKLKTNYFELLGKVYSENQQNGQGVNLVLLSMLKEHLLIDATKHAPSGDLIVEPREIGSPSEQDNRVQNGHVLEHEAERLQRLTTCEDKKDEHRAQENQLAKDSVGENRGKAQ